MYTHKNMHAHKKFVHVQNMYMMHLHDLFTCFINMFYSHSLHELFAYPHIGTHKFVWPIPAFLEGAFFL